MIERKGKLDMKIATFFKSTKSETKTSAQGGLPATQVSTVSRRHASLRTGCLPILALAAMSGVAHAQTYQATAVTTGVLILGSSGSISYCDPNAELASAGLPGATVNPAAVCITIAKDFATPTSDKWTITSVTGGTISGSSVASAFLVDETSGAMIACSVVSTQVGTLYVYGRCNKDWTAPK
jgi:hypothetical protein